MQKIFPTDKFKDIETPFYYYDSDLLHETLEKINEEVKRHEGFVVHYAIKANANPRVLSIINHAGLGADCVSGGGRESRLCTGFLAQKKCFAALGKGAWG